MKRFYQRLWIFSSVQIFLFTNILCFNVPKYSYYNVGSYWSGANICAATVFLWSLTRCTSNSHRLPVISSTKSRDGKEIRHMKTMKSKSKKKNSKRKTDRQGSADVTADNPNEMVIIDELRNHLISKLGVLDPMMCLPKALCGLSSASTATPNSSSELVKDYLHHMKTVILSTTTTPSPPLRVTKKINATKVEENFDDEESGEDTEEDEEDEENDDTSEEEEEEEYDNNYNDNNYNDNNYNNNNYNDFNKYRKEPVVESIEEDDDDIPTESDEQLLRDYLADKTEVTQYLDEEDFQDIPSWWDNIPTKDMTIPLTPVTDWASSLTSYIPSGVTSWFTSALPSFKWNFSGPEKRDDGIFEKDPFFTTFRSGGRSLSEINKNTVKDQKSSSDFQAKLDKRRKILKQYRKLKKKINHRRSKKLRKGKYKPPPSSMKKLLKQIKRMQKKGNLTKVILSKRVIQQDLLDGMDSELTKIENPIARLKTAVEIGKKLDDPRKCNILFSACPWKYDEVLEIIEDSHKSIKTASSEVKAGKVKKTSKGKGGKGSALEKLKQTLKANSKNSSIPAIDIETKETVVKHPLPGGGHLEVKFSHSSENNKVKKNSKPNTKFISSLLKPFQEANDLGVKTKKKKKGKKPIEYKYPKYNYRVSFPNTDQKSIIIHQYEEITTRKPKRTTTTEAPETTMKSEKTNPDMNDIDVDDSGENIIIRIPKEKPTQATYSRNPLLFNPFRIYSSQYPSYSNPNPQYSNQQQQYSQPQYSNQPYAAPTLIPNIATPQYYNQYYQPQLQIQPQLQPNPWYYYTNNRNNFQYKRAWQPTPTNQYFKNNF